MRLTTILACFLLTGCTAFCGKPQLFGVARGGTEARHNVDAEVGLRGQWRSGAEATITGGRRMRVEEPSSRGFPAETLVHGEVIVPLNKRSW